MDRVHIPESNWLTRPARILLSLERHMKCGMGKCGRCQIHHLTCCRDGPVFNYADIKSMPEAL